MYVGWVDNQIVQLLTQIAGAFGISSTTVSSGPKYTPIIKSDSGKSNVVSGVPGKRIRVLRYSLSSKGNTDIQWFSGEDSEISGVYTEIQATGVVEPYTPVGVMITGVGEPLVLDSTEAVELGGSLTYDEI